MTAATTAPAVHTLLGEQFAVHGQVPEGVVQRNGPTAVIWTVTQSTLESLQSDTGRILLEKIKRLREARKSGETVVRGIVSNNPRRPPAAPKPRRSNLDDLLSRSIALITQIAELLDRGPIPDGTMGELSKTIAALQAEYNGVVDALVDVEANLSMARGLMIAYTQDADAAVG